MELDKFNLVLFYSQTQRIILIFVNESNKKSRDINQLLMRFKFKKNY